MADFATLGIKITTSGSNKAVKDLKDLENQSIKTDKATESLIKTIDKFRHYLTLGFLGVGINQIIQMADKMKVLSAQVKLVTDSIEQYNRVNRELFDIAQRTRADLEATTTLYTRSARALKDYGYSQQRILTFTETLNKAMAVGGVGAQEQASALFQLSQALGSGNLQGDEFRTIAEAAPIILDVVAQYMGKTRAEVKKLASEGKITSQIIFESITGASQRISQQFEQMPVTFGQAITQMRNAFMKFFDEILNGSGLMSGLAQGISFLAKNFDTLAISISAVATAKLSGYFSEYISSIKLSSIATQAKTAANVINIKEEIASKTATVSKTQAIIAETSALVNSTMAKHNAIKAEIDFYRSQISSQNVTLKSVSSQYDRLNALNKIAGMSTIVKQLEQEEKIVLSQLDAQTQKLTASQNKLSVAEGQLAISKDKLTASTTRLTLAQRAMNVASAGFSRIIGFLGGPVGILAMGLTFAASSVYEWYSNTQKAKEETLKFADSLNLTNESLREMSAIELNVTRTKLEDSIKAKQEEISKLRNEYERLKKEAQTPVSITYDGFAGVPIEVRRSHQEMIELSTQEKEKLLALTQAEQKLSKAQEEHEKIIHALGSSLENELNIALERLGLHISGVNSKLTEFYSQLASGGAIVAQQAIKIMALTNAILGVSGAIKSVDTQISTPVAKQIERLRLQNALLTAKTPNEKKDIQYKLNAMDIEERGYNKAESEALLSEMNKGSDLRIDREFAKAESKLAKHQDKLLDKWINYYHKLEDASLDNLTRMQREEARALEELKRFASKGVVNHEEYEKAKTLITERYLKERQSLAEKYAPEIGAMRQYQESIKEIEFLRKNGDLSDEQATKAIQNAEFTKWQETADKSNPFNGIKAGVHDFGKSVENVMGNVSQITVNALNGMSDALTDFVLTGKADFRGLAQSIIKDITSMIIKMMIFNALKSAFGGTSFGSFMGWSGSGGGAVPEQRWIGGLVGFDTGGFTGVGGKYEPMGIVHGGEYVLTKEAVSRLGVDYLDYLNYGKSKRGFATGGGVNLPTVHTQISSPKVNIKIINNGEPTEAKVESKQDEKGGLEITVELMRSVAREETSKMLQSNMRPGGMFA